MEKRVEFAYKRQILTGTSQSASKEWKKGVNKLLDVTISYSGLRLGAQPADLQLL